MPRTVKFAVKLKIETRQVNIVYREISNIVVFVEKV